MNYIYNIKRINNGMMFHDRELSVGDVIYGYEPIKYRRHVMTPQDCADFANGYLPPDAPEEDYAKPEEYKFFAFNGSKKANTGKVIAKYKVVEVYDMNNYKDYHDVCWDCENETYEVVDKDYAYKLEKISDVSMELSEFQSIKKIFVGYQTEYGEFIPKEHYRRDYDELDRRGLSKSSCYDYKFKPLTRYNGLTKVIQRSDE